MSKIFIIIAIITVLALAVGAFFWLQQSQGGFPVVSQYQEQENTQNSGTESQSASNSNEDNGSQAYAASIEKTGDSCEIRIVNKATNRSTVVKTITKEECSFTQIKEYSLINQYVLIDAGTSVTRRFTIIHMPNSKIVAEFNSYTQYAFGPNDVFLFVKPETSVSDRPWESGVGSSISSIDLKTGKEKVLKKADHTHDYFAGVDQVGKISIDESIMLIGIKIYHATGENRFDLARIEQWISDLKGNFIRQVN